MATALFIKPVTLKRNSIIDGNVDVDKFIQYLKIAQEIHIRNYLRSRNTKRIRTINIERC
jgi:uncharacterized SAM-dependent methyltransferase